MLASVTSSITSFIGNHGVYAVFVLMAIDAVFPAASELVMLYAGALAAGTFPGQDVVLFGWRVPSGWEAFVVMVLAGTIGYLLGSLVGWAIGVWGGRPFLERRGRWFHLSPERLERSEDWFERRGSWAVFLGRITPVVRSFISIPAGVFRHPLAPYTVLTLIGSALWCFAFAGAGYALGESYARFHDDFRYVEYVVAAAVVGGLILIFFRKRSTRLARRGEHPSR